jgi:Ca-activated chloride channel family protein
MSFYSPLFFLLFIPLILLVWNYIGRKRSHALRLMLPSVSQINAAGSFKTQINRFLPFLLAASAAFAIISLTRPRQNLNSQKLNTDGIDIMMAMDISSSMLAEDFAPNRIEASKKLAQEFVGMRKNDRIGLSLFGGESFTQCPLTTDHNILKSFINNIYCGLLKDGTAIGAGLGSALASLKTSKAKSRVVILLTDGINNVPTPSPEQAISAAKELSIRIYTIGIGTKGEARYPDGFGGYMFQQSEIDEPLLKNMADNTGGKYFRATDESSLKNIYAEIDKLETTKIQTTTIRKFKELGPYFSIISALLLGLFLVGRTVLAKKFI